MDCTGCDAMEVHDLYIIKLFRFELLVIGVGQLGSLIAAGVSKRLLEDFAQRQSPRRICEKVLGHIRYALYYSIISLWGRGKGVAGEIGDLHPSVGFLLDLLAPLFSKFADGMHGREEI
jgi:hypothetical protein